MSALPKIGLYLLTIVFLLLAISFRMIMDVERLSNIARAGTMAVFGLFCLASFFTARGLAKKRRLSWWSAIVFYSVLAMLFLFFHFNSIANSPEHPFYQGYSQGLGRMPFLFKYFYLISIAIPAGMLAILVAFRGDYSKS
jgi:hypothetical protein